MALEFVLEIALWTRLTSKSKICLSVSGVLGVMVCVTTAQLAGNS